MASVTLNQFSSASSLFLQMRTGWDWHKPLWNSPEFGDYSTLAVQRSDACANPVITAQRNGSKALSEQICNPAWSTRANRLGNPTCYRAGAYDVQKSVHFLDPTSTLSAFGSGVLGLGNGLDNIVKQDTGKLRQKRLAFSKSGSNLIKPSSSYFCAKSTV